MNSELIPAWVPLVWIWIMLLIAMPSDKQVAKIQEHTEATNKLLKEIKNEIEQLCRDQAAGQARAERAAGK